jgi:hypothetical protein
VPGRDPTGREAAHLLPPEDPVQLAAYVTCPRHQSARRQSCGAGLRVGGCARQGGGRTSGQRGGDQPPIRGRQIRVQRRGRRRERPARAYDARRGARRRGRLCPAEPHLTLAHGHRAVRSAGEQAARVGVEHQEDSGAEQQDQPGADHHTADRPPMPPVSGPGQVGERHLGWRHEHATGPGLAPPLAVPRRPDAAHRATRRRRPDLPDHPGRRDLARHRHPGGTGDPAHPVPAGHRRRPRRGVGDRRGVGPGTDAGDARRRRRHVGLRAPATRCSSRPGGGTRIGASPAPAA